MRAHFQTGLPFRHRRQSRRSEQSMDNFASALMERQAGFLPGYLGLEWTEARAGHVRGRMAVKPHHLAPNGFLHAGSVVTLADTACGYGSILSKPDAATGFTTIELKANFLGTALDGAISVEARLIHGGRTTQVWDAEVKNQSSDKTIALFRCTQMLLYPR
jgi:1,4-dihydroxy-2-naphthoyl-CoA hydrolase